MAERWKPEYGEKYWFVDSYCGYGRHTWLNDNIDNKIFEAGNCFRTKAEAKAAATRVKELLLSLHHGVATELLAKAGLVEFRKKFLSFLEETPQKNDLQDKQLPEWGKANGYVYDPRNGYGKIKSVRDDRSACYIEFDGGAGDFVPEAFAELKQARVRPWTFEEVPKIPFEIKSAYGEMRVFVSMAYCNKVKLGAEVEFTSNSELAKDYLMSDGKPCGVLEHLNDEGEWVK